MRRGGKIGQKSGGEGEGERRGVVLPGEISLSPSSHPLGCDENLRDANLAFLSHFFFLNAFFF